MVGFYSYYILWFIWCYRSISHRTMVIWGLVKLPWLDSDGGVYFRDFDLDGGDLGGAISWLEPLDTRLVLQYAAGPQVCCRLNRGSNVDSIGFNGFNMRIEQRIYGFHGDQWDLANGNDDFEWTQSYCVNENLHFSQQRMRIWYGQQWVSLVPVASENELILGSILFNCLLGRGSAILGVWIIEYFSTNAGKPDFTWM